ncbi:uncharacterized protein LOC131598240 [Vicia villosa]|uniref:uncharacterized protein LOC131598240 n=1 Tax=Vicia villosa TaxID=3911 RepID=UPI00273C1913|nr:uncharacterized protein LOC131598240 [Vicia villosa]
MTENKSDGAVWKLEQDGMFTVASCYLSLCKNYIPYGPVNRFDSAFKDIWKVGVPLKVRFFGWICFLNKVPTKDSLWRKGILSNTLSIDCVFCENCNESILHSFLLCRNAGIVWREMAEWIGIPFKLGVDLKDSFLTWSSFCHAKRVKSRKTGVVWLATLWNLWLRRNDIVFNDGSNRCVIFFFGLL